MAATKAQGYRTFRVHGSRAGSEFGTIAGFEDMPSHTTFGCVLPPGLGGHFRRSGTGVGMLELPRSLLSVAHTPTPLRGSPQSRHYELEVRQPTAQVAPRLAPYLHMGLDSLLMEFVQLIATIYQGSGLL